MKTRYLLDTNICIYLLRGVPEQVMRRMAKCRLGEVAMSAITWAELEYGVLCASDPAEARIQVDLLARAIPVLPFDMEAAAAFGPIRFSGKERKNDLMDKLIAAHAQALGTTLVTNNTADFERYPRLRLANWTE